MKTIRKQQEPPSFQAWKTQYPTAGYDALSGAVKQSLKTALMQEQGWLCCYCEQRITEDNSHIEHIKPQSLDSSAALDYQNIVCSCQNQLEKGGTRHCGHKKGDWYDSALFISPLDPTCESRFTYTWDGHVYPAIKNDKAATVTIGRLGLDIPDLVDLRKAAIDVLVDLSSDELRAFLNAYLTPTQDGKFQVFWTMFNGLRQKLTI